MDLDRIRGCIAQMKLQEKLALVGGETTTSAIARLHVPSVALTDELEPYSVKEPSALAVGCTFSTAQAQTVSRARSVAAARRSQAFAGTVGCGLIMDPMRPDAAEFFSEDAFLASELLKNYAAAGVIGYVFTDALGQGRYVNRTIDPRALYELYLYPLAVAGKYAAALQLDGGYLNGKKISHSRSVCDIYSSYIAPDAMILTCYGEHDGASGVSGNGAYQLGADAADKKAIAKAIVNGEVHENKLNKNLERTLSAIVKAYEFGKKPFDRSAEPANIVYDSTVLLKNNGLLPTKARNITYFGDADRFDDAAAYRVLPIRDALKKYGAFNVFLVTDYENDGIAPVIAESICSVAAVADTVVVLCGACATPLDIARNIKAILFCPYFPTVYAVHAMLTAVSPRGHLPFTWCADRDAYPRNNKKYAERGDFRYESIYNGYALFNNFASDVMFSFGHGLDYTKYEISKYKVTYDGLVVTLDFVIKNVGDFAGTALCQAYITLLGGNVYGMSRRLAAFKRVALEKTENAHVVMRIDLKDFPVYDNGNNALVPIGGKYRIDIGLSSTDIRAVAEIKVPAGSRVNAGLGKTLLPSYYALNTTFDPSAPEIERLLKVPFIKKPDFYPELEPPTAADAKKVVKRAKLEHKRLEPLLRYKAETTPIR